jgi:hypothetical protein
MKHDTMIASHHHHQLILVEISEFQNYQISDVKKLSKKFTVKDAFK